VTVLRALRILALAAATAVPVMGALFLIGSLSGIKPFG
jgi:hypothetical protein